MRFATGKSAKFRQRLERKLESGKRRWLSPRLGIFSSSYQAPEISSGSRFQTLGHSRIPRLLRWLDRRYRHRWTSPTLRWFCSFSEQMIALTNSNDSPFSGTSIRTASPPTSGIVRSVTSYPLCRISRMKSAGLLIPSISSIFLFSTAISEHSPCRDSKNHAPESEYTARKGTNRVNSPKQHLTDNRRFLNALATPRPILRLGSGPMLLK